MESRRLIKAVEDTNYPRVEKYIKEGDDVNYVDATLSSSCYSNISSALHKAIDKNLLNIVELFFKNNANPNLRGIRGVTPIMQALKSSQVSQELIDLLIKSGADLNHQDDDGLTPLFYAIKNHNIRAAIQILKQDLMLDKLDNDINGETLLSALAKCSIHDSSYTESEAKQVFLHLVKRGASIEGIVHKEQCVTDLIGMDPPHKTKHLLVDVYFFESMIKGDIFLFQDLSKAIKIGLKKELPETVNFAGYLDVRGLSVEEHENAIRNIERLASVKCLPLEAAKNFNEALQFIDAKLESKTYYSNAASTAKNPPVASSDMERSIESIIATIQYHLGVLEAPLVNDSLLNYKDLEGKFKNAEEKEKYLEKRKQKYAISHLAALVDPGNIGAAMIAMYNSPGVQAGIREVVTHSKLSNDIKANCKRLLNKFDRCSLSEKLILEVNSQSCTDHTSQSKDLANIKQGLIKMTKQIHHVKNKNKHLKGTVVELTNKIIELDKKADQSAELNRLLLTQLTALTEIVKSMKMEQQKNTVLEKSDPSMRLFKHKSI